MGRMVRGDEAGSARPTVLTVLARALVVGLVWLTLIPTVILAVPFTFLISALARATRGWALLPLRGLWSALLSLLLATSRLWERAPLLRLPLLVVGVPLAWLAYEVVSLTPALGDRQAKEARLALCDHWPLSWRLWQERGTTRQSNP